MTVTIRGEYNLVGASKQLATTLSKTGPFVSKKKPGSKAGLFDVCSVSDQWTEGKFDQWSEGRSARHRLARQMLRRMTVNSA
jgi:hypothetical protein